MIKGDRAWCRNIMWPTVIYVTKHEKKITYSPAHSTSKQDSRCGPLVCPSKPRSGGLQRICSWHPSMRHSRERGSSQRQPSHRTQKKEKKNLPFFIRGLITSSWLHRQTQRHSYRVYSMATERDNVQDRTERVVERQKRVHCCPSDCFSTDN